jgi:hypothetical protein
MSHKPLPNAPGGGLAVPPRWHVLPFRSAKGRVTAADAQLSNVRLPRPWIVPSFPIQTNNKVLPADG